LLIERPMWAMSVVVLEVLLQYHREVALSGDQELVEAFPAERADEAFRDRVRARRPYRGADDANVGAVKTASKAVVNLLSRSRIRNRSRSARLPRSISRLRAC